MKLPLVMWLAGLPRPSVLESLSRQNLPANLIRAAGGIQPGSTLTAIDSPYSTSRDGYISIIASPGRGTRQLVP
ncbi:MAG: hypothetical protein V3R72_05590 [Gammaproteobacteria bacterium]